MYVTVFSPDGQRFEVPRRRADVLILQENWTQTQPTIEPVLTELPLFENYEEAAYEDAYKDKIVEFVENDDDEGFLEIEVED